MPRTTPSPCVVLFTAPGSDRRSESSPRSGGSGRSDTICSSSPTGAAESMTWPVMLRSPSRMPLQLPDLHPVDAHGVGELVHQRLVRERGLHAAEAAHGAARRVVGEHPVGVHRDRREPVGPEAEGAGVADHRAGRRGVRPAVEQHVRLRVDQGAVALGAELVGHRRRVPVHVAEERLLAAVAHLHRLAGAQRQQAGVHVHRRGPRGRRTRRRRRPASAAPSRPACRGPGRSAAGRRAATGWRRRGRRRRPRPGRRARTPARGRPGPACRPRSRARRRPAPSGSPRRGAASGAARGCRAGARPGRRGPSPGGRR